MKILFCFFIIILFVLPFYPESYELYFPVQWKDDASFPCMDESIIITDPVFGYQKVEAGMAAGLSSAEAYARIKVTVIWDEDSVLQGDTLTVRIVTEPVTDNKPTLYSNYGFAVGLGASIKAFGPMGGPWIDGPGMGLDFNININSSDDPPMGALDSENAKGDDVVDFLSLVPEMKSASKGIGKPIINEYGDTLLFGEKGDGGAGDAMGLFDLASLKLSGGLKINDGNIKLRVGCGNEYFSGSSYQFTWSERSDTLYYKIFIDSLAPESAVDYLYVKDPVYSVNLWNRMGMQLQSLGLTLASSYWINEDLYEDKGVKWLTPPAFTPTEDLIREIPIKIVGSPIYRPDYQALWIFAIPYNHWNDFSDDFPQAACTTDFKIMVFNSGNSEVPEGSLRFTVDKDTVYFEIDTLYQYGAEELSYKYIFTQPGEFPVSAHINYNNIWEELSYENNRYFASCRVKAPQKRIYIGFLKDSVHLLQPDSVIRATVMMNGKIDNITLDYSGNIYHMLVPGNDTVLVSVLPDTSNTDYYVTSGNIITGSHAIDNDTVYINLNRFGSLNGLVKDKMGNPMGSVNIVLGAVSDTTDTNGLFSFDKLIPLSDTFSYTLSAYIPMYEQADTAVHIGSGDSVHMTVTLASPDEKNPVGHGDIVGGYEWHSLMKCTTGDIVLKLSAMDDYSGMYFAEVKNQGGVWDTFYFPESGTDTVMYINWNLGTEAANQNKYFFFRFTDMAYNTSDSIADSAYLVCEGPTGTFTVIDSVTSSESIRAQLNAVDPFINVQKAHISVSGGGNYTFNMTAEPISIPIPSSDGNYTIQCRYENSMGLLSTNYSDNCLHTYEGYVNIDWGKEFSPDNNILLSFDGSIIGVNNVDLTGGMALGAYPYMQTFVPHCNEINAISVYMNSVSRTSHVFLFTDSTDGTSAHMPGHYLEGFNVGAGSSGWCYGLFSTPVPVIPTDTYNIVIFTDSIAEVSSAFSLESCDPSNYTEGNLYGSPSKKGLMWFDMGCDMGFKIYGRPDSTRISNSSNMNADVVIPYSSTYPWVLSEQEGHSFVFAQYQYGGIWHDIINDGIIIDTSGPVIDSIDINRGRLFTDIPCCTVRVVYSDNYSQECSLFINNSKFLADKNDSVIYNFETLTNETKTLNITAKDFAGNISSVKISSIDYDSSGIDFYPRFNNSTSVFVNDRYPVLYFNTAKSLIPDSIRYFESFGEGHWKPFSPSVQCTLNSNPYMHLMVVDIKDNYNKVNRAVLKAIVDSTPPGKLSSASISDNGTDGDVTVYWTGISSDEESGIKDVLCDLCLANDSSSQYSVYAHIGDYEADLSSVEMYKQYVIHLAPRNNAGLFAENISTPVFTVNDNPSPPILIYPSGDSTSVLPEFQMSAADVQTDTTLHYSIEIADDRSFSNIIRVFDSNISADNWSLPRYPSKDTAIYYTTSDDSLYLGNKYYWRAFVFDSVSSGILSGIDSFYVNAVSGIKPDYSIYSNVMRYLFQNKGIYADNVNFKLEIPQSANVKSSVYDIRGACIKTLILGNLSRGGYRLQWDRRDMNGNYVSAGVYFIVTAIDNALFREKVLIVR